MATLLSKLSKEDLIKIIQQLTPKANSYDAACRYLGLTNNLDFINYIHSTKLQEMKISSSDIKKKERVKYSFKKKIKVL